MATNRANPRSLRTDYDMSTVTAFPDLVTILREDHIMLDIIQQLQVTLLMMLLDGTDHLKLSSDLGEALFTSLLGHTRIHIRPFIVLTVSTNLKISSGILQITTLKVFIPDLSMFPLIISRLLKESAYLLIPILTSLGSEESIPVTRL